jgi:biotin carboxylase
LIDTTAVSISKEAEMFTTYKKSNRYILLLKADEFLRDRAILAALRSYPGMVVGMSVAPALSPNRFFDHVLTGDPHRPDATLQAVKAFEAKHGMIPEAVIPITEMTLHSAQCVAEAYGLPFLSGSCVSKVRNKDEMRKAFRDFDLASPRHMIFSNIEELRSAIAELRYPVIVKPCSAAHSVGVIRIDSEDEVQAAYQYCVSGLEGIAESWSIEASSFQVEEYVDAEQEVSVEVFNQGKQHTIIAVTDKSITPPPFFAEVGHMVPSRESDNRRVRELAIAACEALGITHGVSHVEIRIDDHGRPFLIEVAARPGGDGIMDLVERAYAVNLYELHIRSYLSQHVEIPSRPVARGTSAIAFFKSETGKIVEVDPPKELPDHIVSLYISGRAGQETNGSLNYDERLGTVEFFWPDSAPLERENEHLKSTEELFHRIFKMEPLKEDPEKGDVLS